METVEPIADIVQEVKRAGGETFKYCYRCGKCDVVCPWNRVRTFSIRKLVQQASYGVPEIELDDMWRCTTCGTCPSECPRGVGQIEVGVALRRIASEYRVFAGSAHSVSAVQGSVASVGNPLGEDREKRAAWAEGLDVQPFSEGMELLWFVGCYQSYDPRMKKVAVATAKILKRAGVEFGILGARESCCGESIRKTGNEDLFRQLARENIKAFIEHGVKRILVTSPHCFHTFANEYPEFMVRFEVVHLTQLLLRLIDEGRLPLTRKHERTVTYHDPCYLGRHNGIYDEPREVLGRLPGLKLVEMPDTRRSSLCCGGGGGRIWMDTPKEERFADLRMAQARGVGADVLATACPYCISNFEESRLSLEEGADVPVKDVAELVYESLPEAETP